MEIKTSREIEANIEVIYNNENFQQLNVFQSKKWVAVDDILKELRTLEGGALKSEPKYTLAFINKLIKKLSNSHPKMGADNNSSKKDCYDGTCNKHLRNNQCKDGIKQCMCRISSPS